MGISNCIDYGPFLSHKRSEYFVDDFVSYTSGGAMTTVAATSGTAVADDTAGSSKVLLTTAASAAGDFVIVKSTKAVVLPAAGRPGFFATRFTYTNAATTTGVPLCGVSSTTTLTMTSGLDPTASYSGFVVYKRAGDTVFSVQSSNGSTKTTSLTTTPGTDGTYDVEISWNDKDALNAEVVYKIGGRLACDSNNIPIKHTVAYASLVKMLNIVGVQTSSSSAQTAYFDYMMSGQLRSGL